MSLPIALVRALADLLEGVSRQSLTDAAQKISQDYRDGRDSTTITTPAQAAAYAITRMPATYAASSAVFARIAEALPEFMPANLLDVGGGTGAASWAAMTTWPTIASVILLDHNPALRALAAALGLPRAEIRAGSLAGEKPQADLVVASYVLVELPPAAAAPAAAGLWRAADKVIALIEPGTPDGFARIRRARAALIEAGAHILAPCTHDGQCPLTEGDWCHFSQRLARSRDHMLLKQARVPFEDERYSYVVAGKEKLSTGARILAAPLRAKAAMTFKLCDEGGLRRQRVSVREVQDYRRVRRRGWGDLF